MALEDSTFKFGAIALPLTDATDNALLEDADPALFHCLALLTTALETYVAPRLLAQANLCGFNLPSAVALGVAIDPAPVLNAAQFKFPLLCLYRKSEVWDEHTIAFDKSTATWEFAYVLPPLTPAQLIALQPILHLVAVTFRRVLHQRSDPSHLSGAAVFDTAGILKARLLESSYGGFERIVGESKDQFHAVFGTIEVLEREQPIDAAYDVLDGVAVNIDTIDAGGTTLADQARISTTLPVVLTSISPTGGPNTGDTTLTLTVTNARVGTTPQVFIGDLEATEVVVVSATSITCKTPAHEAYATFAADVEVIDDLGQSSNVLEGAFTYTTA